MTIKVVNVSAGDYRVNVQSGGTITLNTGSQAGTVVITGDLLVAGNTTTVESETMVIKDNIITINHGEASAGVNAALGYQAGIAIDRGSLPDTFILFDEQVNHLNAAGNSTQGIFKFRNSSNALIGIQTPSINTEGQNLYLINSSTGYVTVTGTSNYERQILSYSAWDAIGNPRPVYAAGVIALTADEDGLVNTQALEDYVDAKLYAFSDTNILEGNTSVEVFDSSAGHAPSRIVFTVDGIERGQFNNSGFDVDDINIYQNIITTRNTNADLVLRSASGLIELDGYLILKDQPVDINVEAGTASIYTKSTTGGGDTGLYFVNTKVDTDGSSLKVLQDELVSRRRALVFSFIF
jgi:hypothetical protein